MEIFNEDINSIETNDPKRKVKDKRIDHHDKYIIMYGNNPYYNYAGYHYEKAKTNNPKKATSMPIFPPFSFTVTLKNGAYLDCTENGTFFHEKYPPKITLCRKTGSKLKVFEGPETNLIQLWRKYTPGSKYVVIRGGENGDVLARPNHVKFNFLLEWIALLQPKNTMDTGYLHNYMPIFH